MPRLLASMMRFSIWSLMPRPWRPPIVLASITRATWSENSVPLMATGQPSSKRTVTSSGSIDTSGRQWATPMIGSTISIPVASSSSALASCVAPQMLASVEYAFSFGSRYGRLRDTRNSLISARPPRSSTNCWSSHGL